jgi:predicted nucleotidyltransferase
VTLAKPENLAIDLPLERVAAVCHRYGVEELRVFGSALREDFCPESDVDFLVSFEDGELGPWMSKLTAVERELAALLGRRVDLVPMESVKWVIRDRVMGESRLVYANR